jgi:hypothetical protein
MKEEINNIIGFSFECGGIFVGSPKIEVNIVDNKVLCIYNNPLKKNKHLFEISNEDWEEFIDDILKIHILTWKNSYFNPNIEDGTQWEVNINFQNGKKFEILGCNDFPKEWEVFNKIVLKYFPIYGTIY